MTPPFRNRSLRDTFAAGSSLINTAALAYDAADFPPPVFQTSESPGSLASSCPISSAKPSQGVSRGWVLPWWVVQCAKNSLIAQWVKNPPAMQETQEMSFQSMGLEDPLEEEMAAHSSILTWKIPRTEEPDRLQSTGSQKN